MVIWSKAAKVQLQKAFHFISNDSPQNAEKIINNIVDITIGLSKHPENIPTINIKRIIPEIIALLKFTIIEFRTSGYIPIQREPKQKVPLRLP